MGRSDELSYENGARCRAYAAHLSHDSKSRAGLVRWAVSGIADPKLAIQPAKDQYWSGR